MRLLKFLNEEDISVDNIIRDCQPYIQFRKRNNCRFVRGLDFINDKDKIQKRQLLSRKAKGVDEKLSTFINAWLKKNGIVERTKSIPITTDLENAKRFGFVYECFPVGKFDYSFCKSIDFNQNNESDPFQVAYFLWLYLKENNQSYIWYEYVSNMLELLTYSYYLDSVKNDTRFKTFVDFYSKHRTTKEIDKFFDSFEETDNNVYNFYDGYEYNSLKQAFKIDKFPSSLVIDFEFPPSFDEWALPGENVISNNRILSKKLKFTVKELEAGSKNLKSLIKTNKDIKEAVSNNYEIWINPGEFYLVPDHIAKEKLNF